MPTSVAWGELSSHLFLSFYIFSSMLCSLLLSSCLVSIALLSSIVFNFLVSFSWLFFPSGPFTTVTLPFLSAHGALLFSFSILTGSIMHPSRDVSSSSMVSNPCCLHSLLMLCSILYPQLSPSVCGGTGICSNVHSCCSSQLSIPSTLLFEFVFASLCPSSACEPYLNKLGSSSWFLKLRSRS